MSPLVFSPAPCSAIVAYLPLLCHISNRSAERRRDTGEGRERSKKRRVREQEERAGKNKGEGVGVPAPALLQKTASTGVEKLVL